MKIAAIDVGTTKIVAIVGTIVNDQVEVDYLETSESLGVKVGEVINIPQLTDCINRIVKEIENKYSYKMSEVYVGIAGKHIRCVSQSGYVRITNPENYISEDDVKRLHSDMHNVSRQPGESILHILPKSYSVNGNEITSPVGCVGHDLHGVFNIVFAKNDEMSYLKKAVTNAGLNILSINLEPIASARAILTEAEKEEGVVLLDTGGGTSDLIIYQNNAVIHTAVIPLAGNIITEDIRKVFSVSKNNAENLKIS